jgi:hypothetical protein
MIARDARGRSIEQRAEFEAHILMRARFVVVAATVATLL